MLDAHTVITASTGGKIAACNRALGWVSNGGRSREKVVDDFDRCLYGILGLFLSLHDPAHFLDSGRSRLGFVPAANGYGSSTGSSCRVLSCGDGLSGFVRNVDHRELTLRSSDTVLDMGHGSFLPLRLVLK
jgi:hypothetical protein